MYFVRLGGVPLEKKTPCTLYNDIAEINTFFEYNGPSLMLQVMWQEKGGKQRELIVLHLMALQSILHKAVQCVCCSWVQIEAVRDIKGSNNIIARISEFRNLYHKDMDMKRSTTDSFEPIYKLILAFVHIQCCLVKIRVWERFCILHCNIQGVFFTGTPRKNSKYKKVNLG